MTIKDFNGLLEKKVLFLDGATGTELQKRGMPKGVCPEKWVSENPDVIIDVQRAYKDAGANVVYSCTFGCNRFKLEEFGLQNEVYELNKKLAEISKRAIGEGGFVAGDMSPTGKFVEPFGDVPFDEAVEVYKEQAKGLLDGGVDFFVVETMIDIQEMRAAVIAIREICDLPILASMTFSDDGRTLTGTDPVSALITLQSLGANAVGCNCSTGPAEMLKVIQAIKPYAKVPLLAKPNAGLPKLVDGKTVFDMPPEEFGKFVPAFLEAGVNLFGGCCGTSPDYIKEIAKYAKNFKPVTPHVKSVSALSSARKTTFPGIGKPLSVIGERINPTGKKQLQEELKLNKFDEVRRFAHEQKESGAAVLDVNVGMAGIDEKETMVKIVKLLSSLTDLPLCIDSSNPEVIEKALRVYPGRALINSISGEEKKLEKLLPIAKKYGAMFILLPLSDEEIPVTAEGRINIVNKIFSKAEKMGFHREDIVVDGLVMTVSSDQNAAKETLKLLPDNIKLPIQEKLKSSFKGYSALDLYLGLRDSPEKLGIKGENYWIFNTSDLDIFEKSFSDPENTTPPFCFLSFPSMKSGTKSAHTADVVTIFPYEKFEQWKNKNWKERENEYYNFKEKLIEDLLNIIEKNIPGFKDLVVYKELATPLTFEHFTGTSGGVFYGLPATPDRYKMEEIKVQTPIKNLYMTGTDILCNGILPALFTGMATASYLNGLFGIGVVMGKVFSFRPDKKNKKEVLPPESEDKLHGKLIKKEAKDNLLELTFEFNIDFDLIPGQHIKLYVNNGEWRAYSVAKTFKNQLTLVIDTRPKGHGVGYLKNLKIGDISVFRLPLTDMIYHDNGKDNLMFIATGTGLIPFLHMMDELRKDNKKKKITVLFGCMTEKDNFADHFLEPYKEFFDLKSIVCVEKPVASGDFFTGRVTDYLSQSKEDVNNYDYYICGHPHMTESTVKYLRSLNTNNVYY